MTSKNHYSGKQHTTFICQVDGIILENVENAQLSQGYLSRALGLCKMQVYRKIKLATGRSTANYIRYYRLCYAKQFLEQTDWPISQIAYRVGFQDHSYFTRAFVQEFGMSPSNFRYKRI